MLSRLRGTAFVWNSQEAGEARCSKGAGASAWSGEKGFGCGEACAAWEAF
jgi:hypothetical protein